MQMKLGDGLGVLALMVWISYSVGPWWLGGAIMAGAGILNFLEKRARR